jgi:organic hydroperoxide reductase OsmC/OhrA
MADPQFPEFTFGTSLRWTGALGGILSSPEKPDIEVHCPPQFCGGPADKWSPEDFFVGSIEMCLMMTFLHNCQRLGLEISSYESRAEGVTRRVGRSYCFDEVNLRIRIQAPDERSAKRAERLVHSTEQTCLVSQSVKCRVNVEAEVSVAD